MRGVYPTVQLGYPTITNMLVLNQIIRYNGVRGLRSNEDPAITNLFFGTVTLRYSGVPLCLDFSFVKLLYHGL